MNIYVITLPISITCESDSPADALRYVLDRLTNDNINCDDVDPNDPERYVSLVD